MTRADYEQAARRLALCEEGPTVICSDWCGPERPGVHGADCNANTHAITSALIAAHNRAVEAAAEACDGFPDTRMTPEEEAANLMAYGGPSDCEYGCSSLLAHRLRALRIPEEAR